MEAVVKPKKYIRTQMKLDSGEIVDARICVATGEIKPHKYPQEPKMPRARALPEGEVNNIVGEPAWLRIPAPDWSNLPQQGKKVRLNKSNPNNVYLKEFLLYIDAVEDHPVLDDLFVGATSLGEGSKNPLSKGSLFNMLRDLDEINVQTIQAYTGHSVQHCWRIAQCLRVLSNALDNEVDS